MESPTNRVNHSFSSLLPLINKNTNKQRQDNNYELNNEGCKCQMCQKIILNENMKILTQHVSDLQSQMFNQDRYKQQYTSIIEEITNKWKYKRNIRFYLPEICKFQNNHPAALIQKKKDSSPIIINKSKSKLHFFQIQSFFLNGYIAQSPIKKVRSTKNQAVHKAYLNQCIVFAKYTNNCYRMMTYKQIQSIFRSKNKVMKDGLMYLQTIVGGDFFKYVTIIVKLDEIERNQDMKILWQRAKLQVKLIVGQLKLTDVQFYDESEQIQFQNELKSFDINRHLLYLSFKIVLISSKSNPEIMKNSVFKYALVDKKTFLFDLRVIQFGSCSKYWSSNVLQALQIKLKKTMKSMQLDNPEKQDRYKLFQNQLSSKARQLSDWLKSSTQQQWQQMRIIRKRLQKLEQQKKSLEKSKDQQMMRKSFKVRNIQSKKTKQKGELQRKISFSFHS